MKEGKINVKTENIFPVIKKFLYSDHEIFLRELISNAVDATQKMKTLVSLGKSDVDLGDLTIQVVVDKEAKTICVIDKGVGMSAKEVEKYINQIAFSSAEEFLEKYKGADSANIIGHFGLGFYSSFMVASQVDILTKSYLNDAPAVKWNCDGSPSYTMEEIQKTERGTEIVLHITEDSEEFLEESRIITLLKKYCSFLPVSIQCGMEKKYERVGEEEKPKEVEQPRIINNINPLWKQSPANLTDEDYDKFYNELYPMSFEKPIFHIHLNVDFPFNLTGVLYFPKVKNQMEIQKNRVQLYCNQVFITDQLENVIPEFMTLLHGVIDSPDIPLNVSRSYLQSDSNVKKISSHITKKVADKLEEMFKENREKFEEIWDELKVFVQYGSITDEKFYERVQKFFLFKNTDGKYFTFDEYTAKIEALQKDKNNHLIYLYAADQNAQMVYIEAAKERAYDILLMDGFLDIHFVNMLESKLENSRFARVDADVIDKLIQKEEGSGISKLSEKEQEMLKEIFESNINKDKFMVQLENMSENDLPIIITQNEFTRRFQDLEKLSGQKNMFGAFENYQLKVNTNHALAHKLLAMENTNEKENLTKQMIDLALLSQNLLVGEALNNFVKRSVALL